MKLQAFEGQDKAGLSMIEVAGAYLDESNQVTEFNQLLEIVQDYLGLSDQELAERMTKFYTQLNADGAFISLGENRWGLREWYPVDSINEEIVNTIDDDEIRDKHRRPKGRINVFGDDEDLIDYNADDPEDFDEYESTSDVEDEEDPDLQEYKSDLDELGDDELEDGLEGELTVVDEDDEDEEDEDF